MRVFIGPYRKWWGPYQIADLLKYVGVSEERRSSIGRYLCKIAWFNGICNWLHEKNRRKVKIHIHEYDVWSADDTLTKIIHPILLKVRDTKHGTPWTDITDAPHILDEPNTKEYDAGYSEERWSYILDEMIYAFAINNENDWETELWIKSGKKWTPEALEERDRIHARAGEGRRLFAKYYHSLWT